MSNLVEVIKKAAIEAVQASNPTSLVIGVVTSVNPLQILVEQKLSLDEDFLILTKHVTDHYVDMTVSFDSVGESVNGLEHKHTVSGETAYENIDKHTHSGTTPTGEAEVDSTKHKHAFETETGKALGGDLSALTKHTHKTEGKKKIKLHYGLKQGESVILIKIQGGQKYIVLDRLGEAQAEGEWV